MFDFRIITCADGMQVIDPSVKTPYSLLTPVQMQEYIEMDSQITVMERLGRKARRVSEHKKTAGKNLLYKAACMFGFA